jgi:integrase/recombinase XerC
MPGTIDQLVKPVIELCRSLRHGALAAAAQAVDRYFTGPGKRAWSNDAREDHQDRRVVRVLGAGEISRLFGAVVESPVDPFNRSRHREDL